MTGSVILSVKVYRDVYGNEIEDDVSEAVNHPAYYGGEDDPYEVIKVAEAWEFDHDAYLFNVLKYIARPKKGNYLEDLKKARFYLDRKIQRMEEVTKYAPKPASFQVEYRNWLEGHEK